MTLFRLDASMRAEGSVSRRLADTVEAVWQAEHPNAAVVRRDVGSEPLPATAWPQAVAGSHTAAADRTPAQSEAVALAARLADELVEARAYLFAVPLYNFGVPAAFKSWVDLVITDPRMAPSGPVPLAGRPAVLAVVRGGGYGPGTPREGWDHGTPWVRRILADVFRLDVDVVETELTLADVNPAMEALRPLAAESLRAGLELAGVHGAELARRVAAAPA
jgi:FMN-dependent NADH-azoreductase